MALSKSIKQIAIFDECIYHLFFFPPRARSNQLKAKWLLLALLNKEIMQIDVQKRFQQSIILMQIMICASCDASDGFPRIRCTMKENHSGLDRPF